MSKKIVVQVLSRYPIAPKTYLVYLHDDDWPTFIWADNGRRMEILKPYVRDIRLGLYAPRELIWIELESIKEPEKEEIINALQSSITIMNEKMTLMDGSQLECYPIAFPSEKPVSGDLSLDTTGRYLQIGNKPHSAAGTESEEVRSQMEIDERLFYEHAHLFLANADRILADSRLFLAPVHVVNGLAFTGTSGFRKPTLGIYIEWWIHYKDASIDGSGNPIWYISGSPLSGSHACYTADSKGEKHRAQLSGGFSPVWSTFVEVNNRYNEFKGRYMAYDLKEVIDILEGTTDSQQIFKLHLRLEKARCDNYIDSLKKSLKREKEQSEKYVGKIQNLLFKQNIDEVREYYDKCVSLRTAADQALRYFRERRIKLRKELRSGCIDNKTYEKTLVPLKRQAEEAERQYRDYEYESLKKIFGEDSHYMCFNVINDLLTEKQSEK